MVAASEWRLMAGTRQSVTGGHQRVDGGRCPTAINWCSWTIGYLPSAGGPVITARRWPVVGGQQTPPGCMYSGLVTA